MINYSKSLSDITEIYSDAEKAWLSANWEYVRSIIRLHQAAQGDMVERVGDAIHEAWHTAGTTIDEIAKAAIAAINMGAVVPNGILSREEDTQKTCPAPAKIDPDMPSQQLRLHMGEMTAQEERTARAALHWANSITGGDMTFTNSSCVKQKAMGDLQVQKADDLPPPANIIEGGVYHSQSGTTSFPHMFMGDASTRKDEEKTVREKCVEACHIAGLDPDKVLRSEEEMWKLEEAADKQREIFDSDFHLLDKLRSIIESPSSAKQRLEELQPYLATRKPIIESALENAAEILANFKGEPTATKLEQWQACYAMLFKQMNDLVAMRKPVATDEIPVITDWKYIHRHFVDLWHRLHSTGLSDTPKEFADGQVLQIQSHFRAPVPVSLKDCAISIAENMHMDEDDKCVRNAAKAVLESAQVKYE